MPPEVLLKKRKQGPSIRDFQYTVRGNRPVAERFSRPQTLSSDNIAGTVRRVIGAFGNLPSNPSNESGSARSSSGSGAGPSYVDTQQELHDRFRIPRASTASSSGPGRVLPRARPRGRFVPYTRERQIANSFHPTITFMAEISETEITFLDTKVYKGETFHKKSILDVQTHYKPKETFQFTNFYSCHPLGLTKGFIKGGL